MTRNRKPDAAREEKVNGLAARVGEQVDVQGVRAEGVEGAVAEEQGVLLLPWAARSLRLFGSEWPDTSTR